MPENSLKRTPLYQTHLASNAKLVEFGGWEMPVQYSGIVAEHKAVRNASGLFDVSHMGEFEVSGPGAKPFLHRLAANDIEQLAVGRCHYSFLLNEHGGTVDDTMIYRTSENTYLLVVNASNIEKDWQHVSEIAQGFKDLQLENKSDSYALLAFQGPETGRILSQLTRKAPALKFHCIGSADISGHSVLLAASGYTGENGFEIFCSPDAAVELWQLIMDAGDVTPAGLGARDTLRLEASLALYGHELDESTSPLEANLGFAVRKTGGFIGADVIQKQRMDGIQKKLVMLEMIDRGIPRQGYVIQGPNGEPVGEITSGSVSPWFETTIAMGFVPPEFAKLGQELNIEIRNRILRSKVVSRPYYKRPKL